MRNSDESDLWQDALDESAGPAFTAQSLEQTLAWARHRRRRRTAARFTVVASALGLSLWLLLPRPAAIVAVAPPPPASEVRQLTDDELLSRFPGRAVALIGPPEHQQLLFLDDPR